MAAERSVAAYGAKQPASDLSLAQLPVIVLRLQGDEGVVTFVSAYLADLLKGRKLLGRPMRQAFPELEGQGWFACVDRCLRGAADPACEGAVVRLRAGAGPAAGELCCTFSFQPDTEGRAVIATGLQVSDRFLHMQRAADDQRRYQAFIQNSSVGIWRFELDAPIPADLPIETQLDLAYERAYLAEANDAMAAMYGYGSAEPLVGARLGDLLVRSDPANEAYLRAFLENGYRLSGVDSHELDAEGRDKFFRNSLVGVVQDGMILRAWGTQQDVTDQQQAENALRTSEERLDLAIRASHIGIWEWDIGSNTLTWSDELKRMYGLPADADVSYDYYLTLLHPDCRDELQHKFQESLRTGESYVVEHQIVWPDGEVHWVLGRGQAILIDGKPVRMIGTGMNIDERKHAELQLRESEARFRAMADSAPVMIWETDGRNRTTYLNRAWWEFIGKSVAADKGAVWLEAIHPDERDRMVARFNAAAAAREAFTQEYRVRRHDGVYRWILDKGEPRLADDGSFLGFVGSCVDIHDIRQSQRLKAMNTALKSQRTQLLALNSSKDEFISLASHQLRTPATGVKQYIGMLLEGYSGDLAPDQAELLRVAYESNERQLQIIDDLLRVAHVDAGKVTLHKEPTDLAVLIRDVVKEQHDTFRKRRQRVRFSAPASSIVAEIDPSRIRMVVENLIDNAGKYSPPGRDVSVRLGESGGVVSIAVHDQGVGIAEADIGKLFQKFSRVNNPLSTLVGGTGIGLYWAKKIIDMHDGAIGVESKQDEGSTFTITLPKGES